MKVKLNVVAEDFAYSEEGKEIEFDVTMDHVVNTVDITIDNKIYTVEMKEFISMCKAFS